STTDFRTDISTYHSPVVGITEQATRLGSRAVLNATLVLGARVVSRLIALVMVVKLATFLGPDGYGRYTTLVAYSALVSVGADLGFFVWAYAASFGFTCLYTVVVIQVFRLGRVSLGFDLRLFRSWLALALPFALGAFLTNLYFRADVPILSHFRPFQEVGWYQ